MLILNHLVYHEQYKSKVLKKMEKWFVTSRDVNIDYGRGFLGQIESHSKAMKSKTTTKINKTRLQL